MASSDRELPLYHSLRGGSVVQALGSILRCSYRWISRAQRYSRVGRRVSTCRSNDRLAQWARRGLTNMGCGVWSGHDHSPVPSQWYVTRPQSSSAAITVPFSSSSTTVSSSATAYVPSSASSTTAKPIPLTILPAVSVSATAIFSPSQSTAHTSSSQFLAA